MWTVSYMDSITGTNAEWYTRSYNGHVLTFQGVSAYALTPEEAWNIDTKIDDGKAGTGKVFITKPSGAWMPDCGTTDDVNTSEYQLTRTEKSCSLHMISN